VEDRSGHLWIGTYGDGLKRYDPKTGKVAVFRHDPADPHSLNNDIVYSLMVDRQGFLWAGTDVGLNRCEDPVTGRFRSWKGDPVDPSPTDVRAMVEDSNGVLWLVSGTLQRFDPATGRFTAYTFDSFGTGTAGRRDSPFLVKVGRRIAEIASWPPIAQACYGWLPPTDCCALIASASSSWSMTSATDCRPAPSTASSKIATGTCG
jgi:sugar lactone lactonase YvrE